MKKNDCLLQYIKSIFIILLLLYSPLHAQGLPDTGQIQCDDGTINKNSGRNNIVNCSEANTGDNAIYPDQDGRYGRDAAAQAGVLIKIGGGHAGFDYTKVCNSGEKEGIGSCATNPTRGSGLNDWGCTYDNITELYWEIKTDDGGFQDINRKFSWYDAVNYPLLVNGAGICGFYDWRLPSKRELYTIRNLNTFNPAIDTNYFPNIKVYSVYWTGSRSSAYQYAAWGVSFFNGSTILEAKSFRTSARLVRSKHSF